TKGTLFGSGSVVFASATLTALGLVFYLQNRLAGTTQFFDPVTPMVALAAPAVGAVLVSRRPFDRVGWLLCAGGFGALAFFAEQYAVYALVAHRGSLPGGVWMGWIGSWTWMLGLLPLSTLLLLMVPDGRLPSRQSRRVAWAVVATVAVAVVCAAMAPDRAGSASPVNPVGVSVLPQLSALAEVATGACSFLLGPLCLAALIGRYLGASPQARRQLGWFLGPAILAVLSPFAGLLVPLGFHQAMGLVAFVGLAAGVLVAAVKGHRYEIDREEVGLMAMVNGVSLAGAVAVYWITGRLLDSGVAETPGLGASVLGVLAAAAAWRPLRNLIGKGIDHLLAPRRAYQALISLGRCLEASIVPDDVLPALAGTIASALELSYVAVEVGRGEEVTAAAVHGEPGEDIVVVPLVHQHEVVGRLTVAPPPGKPLPAADLRLLRDLASQAGAAAYSVRVTADLRLSKERLVTAREEEWRHVRRELHDRLGPLNGILLGIAAGANVLAGGDALAGSALLGRLRTELRSEIDDIRALIGRLRPRSLVELGLAGALQRQAALSALPPRSLSVTVEAADLGHLPAAVEVAAYQITAEALTNVRRHAVARCCTIRLDVDDGWLEVEVTDDGIGLAPDFREGVGLACMRERASDLGGSVSVEAAPERGTRVYVEIPVGNQ
ncbi:MAG: hypothetical protein QOE57_3330, partial [Acidimicrobiaceae bacterium]|nr:hypothetical protein [Acidimicrobiaceae bacterium]